jgi:CoA:oxalate CoA-transferase
MGAGLFAAMAILAALHEREKSGKGQWIDVAMVDSQVALCENACARHFATGEIPQPLGSRHPLMTPFQILPTKDGYFVLITVPEEDWQKFCRLAGREDLIGDPRFRSHKDRVANYSVFEPILNEITRTKTTSEWLALLEPQEIMCGPVNNIAQVVADPHIKEREMVIEVAHPRVKNLRVMGTPMKFSRTKCRIEKACPDLGEHTTEILSGMLGISSESLEELRQAGVI